MHSSSASPPKADWEVTYREYAGRGITEHVTPDAYSAEAARYAKGCVAVTAPGRNGWKSEAGYLLEALNARYSGRERAYIVSASKFKKFEKLFAEGWTATVFGTLEPPGGLHREAVERALKEGRPVPAEVLADYPDLSGGKT